MTGYNVRTMAVETPAPDPQTLVLSRLVRPSDPDLARYFLDFDFTDDEKRQAAELAELADAGEMTTDQRRKLDGFVCLNNVLGTLRSKARMALGHSAPHAD